jgi:membrane complex biogenesis BtpA family protein
MLVRRSRKNALETLFGKRRAIIGVVHLLPLPGSPDYTVDPVDLVYRRALQDARAYGSAGFDALIIENHGDIPFLKPEKIGPETAACMAVASEIVRREVGLPIGINVLANGAITALAVAKAAGATFIRVNQWANAYVANEGLIEGPAAEAMRYRGNLRANDVHIFADVHVKHGAHAITADRSIAELSRDVEFFNADVAIATGQRTGDAATPEENMAIKEATTLPVFVGSGVSIANVRTTLSIADGIIVGSSLKKDGVWWNEVDPARAEAFILEAREAR